VTETTDRDLPAVVLPADTYWKLRTMLLEHRELQRQMGQAQEAIDAAMLEAGLDPRQIYRLDDATTSAMVARG
jgi:hypothetical protein